jgi:hypothetical protein
MKYFTKEWYQEMQVSGFLVFQETREDWDEILTYYQDEGIDFQINFTRGLGISEAGFVEISP